MKFSILPNRVYDFTNFTHPSGNYLLTATTGRELDRFFYRAYSLEEIKEKRYAHQTTEIAILNKYYIGEYNQGERSILTYNENKHVVTNDFMPWVVKGVKPIRSHTSLF